MTGSPRPLLDGLIDYAGLFPPAALPMRDAVAEYAAQRGGAHGWMLGRFVLPVTRLAEFATEAEHRFSAAADPWRLSAVLGTDPDADIAACAAFNSAQRGATCDAVEIRAVSVEDVARIGRAHRTASLATYVEIPVDPDPSPLVEAIAGRRLFAKIRTGGVTRDAFPAPEHVVRFIRACLRAGVPFKATAGLHHPVRGEYPLTYEPASARAPMYGFLNVFLATAILRDGGTEADALALLTESDPSAFAFVGETVAWRDRPFVPARLSQLRERAALSFGSCSFAEPVADLTAMGAIS